MEKGARFGNPNPSDALRLALKEAIAERSAPSVGTSALSCAPAEADAARLAETERLAIAESIACNDAPIPAPAIKSTPNAAFMLATADSAAPNDATADISIFSEGNCRLANN